MVAIPTFLSCPQSWPLTFCTQSCDASSLSRLCMKPNEHKHGHMEKKWSLKHRRNGLILEFHFIGSVIGKWKRDILRREQGNQINEGKKSANSIASVKNSRDLRQWCEAGRQTETFAIILLHKNEMAEKRKLSVEHWEPCRQQCHTALHYTVLFGGIKYQEAAHFVHGSNFPAQSKEQLH